MSTGPCLCGDPYCGSCGDPAAAKHADWLEHMSDVLDKLKLNESEAVFIEVAIPQLIENYRVARKSECNDCRADQAMAEDI